MNSLAQELRHVTKSILDLSSPAWSLRDQVMSLKSILETASGFSLVSRGEDIGSGETITSRGVAISPTMAAMCVDDFARTVQFLRGVHAAIQHEHELQNRRVRVLYAGCGPWATLAVPLMSVLSSEQVRFTLLDMHSESIRSVERLISALDLAGHVDSRIVCDAGSHKIDPEDPPDIVVVEMIRAALEHEPQVEVSAHLLRQAPNALLIPERISVDLAWLGTDGVRDTEIIAELINVDREFLLSGALPVSGDRMQLRSVRIPQSSTPGEQLTLLTSIRIYSEFVLSGNDSGITIRRPLSRPDASTGDVLHFSYEFGKCPGIRMDVDRD